MPPILLEEALTDATLRWRLAVPPADHPIFAGHFPGYPVLPGVIVLGWMVAAAERFRGGEAVVPTRLHNVKFPRVLLPGQVVELVVGHAVGGRVAVRVESAEGIHAMAVVEAGAGAAVTRS